LKQRVSENIDELWDELESFGAVALEDVQEQVKREKYTNLVILWWIFNSFKQINLCIICTTRAGICSVVEQSLKVIKL
jgi:hypothetical protein